MERFFIETSVQQKGQSKQEVILQQCFDALNAGLLDQASTLATLAEARFDTLDGFRVVRIVAHGMAGDIQTMVELIRDSAFQNELQESAFLRNFISKFLSDLMPQTGDRS